MPKKQKSGLYRAKVKIGVDAQGKDVYKYVSAKTKRELEQRRQEVIDFYINGTGLAADRLFGEYAVEWYKVRKEPYSSYATQTAYRSALNKEILPVFGNRRLRAIQAMELQEFMSQFKGKSEAKITIIHASLRGIFESACQDRIVDRNPMQYIAKPEAAPPAEKRALTLAEREALERTCKTSRYGAFLATMYYLGVRPGEAIGLKWGDFDWQKGVVHIQRDVDGHNGLHLGELKTKKSNRFIPIPAPLRAILWPLREHPDMLLFHTKQGTPVYRKLLDNMWLEIMRDAGLVADGKPLFTPHTLRHNYVTMCWENGIDSFTTMQLAGHSNISVTMDIYTHLSEAQMEKTKQEVEDMFKGSGEIVVLKK